MKAPLFAAILLASCSAAHAPPPLAVPPPELSRPPAPARRTVAALPTPPIPPTPSALAPVPTTQPETVGLPQTVAVLSAEDIIAAADQARIDALGYIVWSKSQPDNITRMNTLTDTLTAAVKQMREHATSPGVYVATHVIEARGALIALRTFLRTKGD
jgi:hypothetical protein